MTGGLIEQTANHDQFTCPTATTAEPLHDLGSLPRFQQGCQGRVNNEG